MKSPDQMTPDEAVAFFFIGGGFVALVLLGILMWIGIFG
jgi:hypothetical protein